MRRGSPPMRKIFSFVWWLALRDGEERTKGRTKDGKKRFGCFLFANGEDERKGKRTRETTNFDIFEGKEET